MAISDPESISEAALDAEAEFASDAARADPRQFQTYGFGFVRKAYPSVIVLSHEQ